MLSAHYSYYPFFIRFSHRHFSSSCSDFTLLIFASCFIYFACIFSPPSQGQYTTPKTYICFNSSSKLSPILSLQIKQMNLCPEFLTYCTTESPLWRKTNCIFSFSQSPLAQLISFAVCGQTHRQTVYQDLISFDRIFYFLQSITKLGGLLSLQQNTYSCIEASELASLIAEKYYIITSILYVS